MIKSGNLQTAKLHLEKAVKIFEVTHQEYPEFVE